MKHDEKVAAMIANLPSRTGRSLDEWLALLAADGPTTPSEQRAWLKDQGLGHFQARLVVSQATSRP